MAAFDFPASPSNGAIYTANGITYIYESVSQTWKGGPPAPLQAPITFIHMPAGMIFHMLVTTVPAGCLELNGQAVSRSTYSALFTHYGTAYGVGDGSTTFNLPDMDGIALAGRDPTQKRMSIAGGNDLTVTGKFVGVQVHTLTLAQMAAHAHTAPDHLHVQTQHYHTLAAHSHTMADHTHLQVAHIHSIQYSNASVANNSYLAFLRGQAAGYSTGFSQTDGGGNLATYMNATHGGTLYTGSGGPANTDWSAVGNTGAADRVLTTENQGGGAFHQNTQPTRAAMCLVTTGGQ
jgi:microcystin-dependent protein